MTDDLGAWVVARAQAEGFDDAAVVGADAVLPDVARVIEAVEQGRMGPLAWMRDTLDQRVDIKKRLAWARSVVVVVANYYPGAHDAADDGKAKVSRYAWGQDYHHVLRRKLRRVRKALLDRVGLDAGGVAHRCAPFNDVDAVLERAWAQAAGLGFIGKSSMLIHKSMGTWTFIGGLVTSADLGRTQRSLVADGCGSCTACLDACPTRAIVAPYVVDARRCLVTWNVEEPDAQDGDAPELRGHGWAVGCDVCQEVCPWNRFQRPTTEPRFLAKPGHPPHRSFSPDDAPTDVDGTPLARPGQAALSKLARRALK